MSTLPLNTSAILTNYEAVQSNLIQAAQSVDRDPKSIKVVVVTKGHSIQALQAAVVAGIRVLGENYVEEAQEKMSAFPSADLEWHMIGHLQSRKASAVCGCFDWLHSLDSLKLANRLDRFCSEAGLRLPVLIQLNVSGEQSKSGIPAWQERQTPALLDLINQMLGLPNLLIKGLMTMPPYFEDPERSRPFFRRLRSLQMQLMNEFPHGEWSELSMGMSGDYPIAVQEGATILRIGTAIMGPRG